MPVGHIALSETPAEEHGVAFGVLRGKIDQALVKVLDLNADLLELVDDGGEIGRGIAGALLQLSDALGVEAATVPRDRAFHLLEPTSHVDEASACLDEPLDERSNHLQGVVRLFLREEPHRGMLNSAVA
jgi:hypothetical protein